MRYCHIINGSSAFMTEVYDNSVDLIFTSPPYGSVVAYNRDNPQQIGNYKFEDYFKMIKPVYEECKRVLKPGRKLMVNIADIPAEGVESRTFYRYGDFTVNLITSLGFELSEIIVWDKGRCRGRGGAPGTFPYPASPVLLLDWEYVYVFRRPGKADYSHVKKEDHEASRIPQNQLADVIYSVWAIRPETKVDDHPAPFPVGLPARAIMLYSFKNEVVLDPFGGSGTTGMAALELSRSVILYELEEKFIPIIKKRVNFGQRSLIGESIWWRYSRHDPNDPTKSTKLEDIEVKSDDNPFVQQRYRKKDLGSGQQSLTDL